MQIISSKLHGPQTKANLIERPHLLARLDDGLKHKLILVSAPPGFGKSTIAGQWLASCGLPIAWVSLDEADNHLSRFLNYICAAINRSVPNACSSLQGLLTTSQLPGVERLADLLIEELHALPVESLLVLDDYHHIGSGDVHQVMRYLLRYLPSRLHLMILTRIDPPLALGRLRARRQVTEIRAADLSLSLPETRQFLQNLISRSLPEEVIRSLQARTEGWIIGLQLAGISLRRQPPDRLLARFGGSHRLLVGYLVEEVMNGLPQVVIEFLTRTALVKQFCAPLGNALMAGSAWPGSSHTTIEQLAEQNLFVIPLDDEGNWYRYHDLFHDFLLHRLKNEKGEEELARLNRQASVWLAQAGRIEDALQHALAAGDEQDAAEIIETNLHPLLNRGIPWSELGRWLDLLPEQFTQTHPGLRIAQLYMFALRWDLAAIAASIDHTVTVVLADSTGSAKRRQQRLAVLDLLRGYLLYWQGKAAEAIPLFQRGLEHLVDRVAYSFTVDQATHLLAQAYAYCGERETALALMQKATAEAITHHRPTLMIFLGVQSLIQLRAGDLVAAAATAEQVLTTADLQDWSGTGLAQTWRGWAYYFLGAIRYEQNDLVLAAQQWRQIEALRYQVNPGTYHDSLVGLAFKAQAQNETVQALAYAQEAWEFAVEQRSPPLLASTSALEARLALISGDHAAALRHAQELDTSINQSNSIWLEPLGFTVLRVYLAEATPAALQKAQQLVETCLHRADEAHNTRQIIPLLALQGLVWRALRNMPAAFDALHRALTLGEPGNFTRSFLDLGTPLAQLLEEFVRRRGSSAYTKRLLAAFARIPGATVQRELLARYARLHGITPLTPRELELLPLLAQRLTVAEIAGYLVISPNTVKKHLSNIYAKLGVRNRRQAVAKAIDVGLLPPS